MSQPTGSGGAGGRLSLTRRVGVPNQNGILLRLPDGRQIRLTLWEWPRGQLPTYADGTPLQVRVRIDAPHDVGVVREDLAQRTDPGLPGAPPSTPSQPGDDHD